MRAGDARIIVRSRVVHITLPRLRGGVLWNRPVSVSVQISDKPEQTLPIHDVTRTTQILLLALGLIGAYVVWLRKPRRAG